MSALPTPSLAPAERFARLLASLLAMLGARLERPGRPGLPGPLILAAANRLNRIFHRLARYAARWQAGTLTPPRPRPTTPRPPTPRRRAPAARAPDILPAGQRWLVRLVPGIGVGASHLRHLLDDPEMAAMLRAAPQIGRTLRPLWRMLSADRLPDILRPSPPDPAPPPAVAACPVPPAEPRPPAPSRPPRGLSPPAPEVAAPAGLFPAPA